MNGLTRYNIGKGPLSYELPVVREHDGKEATRLAVSASGWPEALQTALTWALAYTERYDKEHTPPTPVCFWPVVRHTRYAGAPYESITRRLAKRIDGAYVWAEQRNQGEGSWLNLDMVKP